MKKIIVIGVIALFIVVGFQPAFAIETKSSVDTIENEGDCDCKEVSDVDLDRLNKFTGIKDLSNRFSTLEGIKSGNYTICTIMFLLAFYYEEWETYFLEISWSLYHRGHLVLALICGLMANLYEMRCMRIGVRGQELDCWWVVE